MNLISMNYATIDIFFAIIVGIFMVHGSIRGFIDEFFSKLAFLVALLASFFFYSLLIPLFKELVSIVILQNIFSFVAVFIVVYIIVRLIQKGVGLAFQGEILKGLDKSLGVLLGAVEGLLIVGVILFILYSQQLFDVQSLLKNSIFVKILSPLIFQARNYFYENIGTKYV